MTREEIIEQLDSIVGTYEILLGNGVNSDILDVDDIVAIREAISALSDYDKMQEISLDLAFENDELINKSRWIPVSERLPKIADVYRVTRRLFDNRIDTEPFYMVDACFFDGTNTWHNDNRINHERGYADDVIAWQENPEPYKAEKGGE